jgi:uncharacterized protein YndB with AHSA1/START domain
MIVELSTAIARPPAEVFAFVSDVRNEPQWHTDVLEARLSGDGPVTAGSRFGIRIKPSMGLSEGTVTVAEYSPPRRVVLAMDMGKMSGTLTHTVEPDGAGTRFIRRIELHPSGPMRLMTPLMRGMVRKANTGFLANLKQVLERG